MQEFITRAKQKVEQAELYRISARETPVRFENNRLLSIDSAEQIVYALRIIKDGKLGFATSSSADLDQLLTMAMATARFGREWDVELPGAAPTRELEIYHQATVDVPLDQMVNSGQELIDVLRDVHPEILAGIDLSKTVLNVELANSNGFNHKYTKNLYAMSGYAELMEGKNLLAVYSGFATGKLANQAEKLKQYLEANIRAGRKNVAVASDHYPVIFTPWALPDILRPLLASADGKAVEKGFSPWKGKLGQQLFAPEISLYDDATLAWGPESRPFDDEGVPTARNSIIERGKVNSFLLDLATAKALGMQPTGNGFRGRASDLPSPGTSNIILESSDTTGLEAMIKATRRGVIIHELMGAWAGNPYSGQVSGNIALGYLIENGEIVGRLKDSMVSINCFQAFKNQIDAVSTEKEWTENYLLPHVKFTDVSISAKK